jgi:anaerobic magnesium-protoporphyrin IX monomethyl ester cyclase
MRVALVNPAWNYDGSIYFGCREEHLPLELGYSKALLEARRPRGADVRRPARQGWTTALPDAVAAFAPDLTVVTTAPTYLFWRCAPPELRVPRRVSSRRSPGAADARSPSGRTPRRRPARCCASSGRHRRARRMRGDGRRTRGGGRLAAVAGTAWLEGDAVRVNGAPRRAASSITRRSVWPEEWLGRPQAPPSPLRERRAGGGSGGRASRGCPYACTFCAKIDFRDKYRRRDLDTVLAEIDGLIAQASATLLHRRDLPAPEGAARSARRAQRASSACRRASISGSAELLELLGCAGCVSIEAGVESLSVEGREALMKRCKLDTTPSPPS